MTVEVREGLIQQEEWPLSNVGYSLRGSIFSNKLERGPLAEGLCVDQTSLLLLSSFSSPSQHGENGERQSNRGTKALIKKKKKGKKEREKKGV